ncbi:ABC transporter ATP-binding protein [Oceanirhabdus sp. W0125-5]|uniref:ABC transporter ATP-binding protein n=1 Tax=Oceanirhabdus sp. W0125-5 TaxID=2999116 RepID=UPI0022F2F389|nr:ABC transporter ATP-binding protein [Oceanirhabdus sp. W0125-5]WBW97041.1 ABC transporter ATP-binding protein [Oceanirhabdus sp. W0125-5]
MKKRKEYINKDKINAFLWMLSFLKNYWKRFLITLFVAFGVALCQLLIPQYFNILLDYILNEQKNLFVYKMLAISLIIIVITMILLKIIHNIFQKKLQERVLMDIQIHVFKQLHRLGIPYFEGNNVGDSLAILTSEIDAIQGFYRNIFPKLIWNSVYFVISIICMFSINSKLTAIFICSVTIYYIIWPFTEKRRVNLTQKLQKNRKALSQKIYGSLSAFLEVRAYNRENWEINRLRKEIIKFNNIFVKAMLFSDILNSFKNIIIRITALIIFGVSFYEVKEGNLSIGAFTAYIIYYFSSVGALTILISSLTEQYFVVFQAKYIYDLCNQKPNIVSGTNSLEYFNENWEIEFKDVSFSYQNISILKNVSFTISKGERIAFVGDSGCGKSTILKLISRFYDPSNGAILLNGISLKDLQLSELRDSIGYLFQENYIFAMSVLDNIKFGNPSASFDEVVDAAKDACIHDEIMKLPEGYHTPLGERGFNISGGQKQRIAIARLFVKNPEVIILDEATSALDNYTESKIVTAMNRRFENSTVIAVAHRFSSVKDYDRLVLIEDGEIVESGNYSELSLSGTKFHKYVITHEVDEVS